MADAERMSHRDPQTARQFDDGAPEVDTPRPLTGLRVVEFSHMVMGPTAGLVLGDLGADVIKVEPLPDGDNTRRLTGSGAGFFPMYNRNKRSVGIDIKSKAGYAVARRLIDSADVMIENFRPGGMDKLGLGWESVRRTNPRLVYLSAKGFLPGPYANRTALDEVVQMMAGLAYMTGPPGRPLRAGASVNDVMGGMFGVIGVLAALRQRDATGEGSQVTSGLFETCAFLMGQHMAQYAATGVEAAPMPNRLAAWAVYDVFDCADGQIFVGVVSDTQWRAFCDSFSLDDLKADPALATNPQRCHARDRFMPRIRALFGGIDQATLSARCAEIGLPFAPIARPVELFDDPHLLASGGLVDITVPGGEATATPALPISLSGRRPGLHADVPAAGEHTRQVLESLGYAAADIENMLADGTIGSAARQGSAAAE